MTEFKKGDRVLVEGVVYDDQRTVKDGFVWVLFAEASRALPIAPRNITLAPDQPLKEGDQVITLGGSHGFIRAIYMDEAYVVLLNSPTRRSVLAELAHLRRADGVDVKV